MTRVKPLFLLATDKDGSQVVAEFSRLEGSGEGYVSRVFAGAKTFNAWKIVGDTHPVSGEKVLLRQRVMLNGKYLAKVEPVQPKEGRENDHGYDPDAFEKVTEVQGAEGGKYVCPAENGPEGAVPGVTYPIHREANSLEKYVILKAAVPTEGNLLDGEVRYWIERNRVTTNGSPFPSDAPVVTTSEPGDGDDDLDGWAGGNDDEDR
jgi:hypothetical protein